MDNGELQTEHSKQGLNSRGRQASVLSRYQQLDHDPADDRMFSRLAELASISCSKPISCIYLLTDAGQQLKACYGCDTDSVPEFRDLLKKITDQPGVLERTIQLNEGPGPATGSTDPRYVAGVALQSSDGDPIGSLVVMGKEQEPLTKSQKKAIQLLSIDFAEEFELTVEKREMEKKHAEKDELIRIVSHDLRNPLVGIIGFSELMKEEVQDAEHRRMLEYIESAGNSMLDVVSVLLNSEYIRNEAFIIKRKRLDAAELARDVIDLHRPLALLKDLNLTVEMPDDLTCNLDPEKWKQIVSNLLSNAVKFSAPGGNVELTLEAYENRRKHLKLRISDNGIGMPAHMVENLFSGKESIRRSGTDGEQSTGFGMYIVNKYVALMKGSLNVFSEHEKGTTVEIQLPV